MTDLDRVRAEIERRMELYKNTGGFFTGCIGPNASAVDYYYSEDQALLFFINSLQSQHKTNQLLEECLAEVDPEVRKEVHHNIDLDNAAEDYAHISDNYACWIEGGLTAEDADDIELIKKAFIAGARWQLSQDLQKPPDSEFSAISERG